MLNFLQNKWVHVAALAILAAVGAGLPAAGVAEPEWLTILLSLAAGGTATHAVTKA